MFLASFPIEGHSDREAKTPSVSAPLRRRIPEDMLKSEGTTVSLGVLTEKSSKKLVVITSASMAIGVILIGWLAYSQRFSSELLTVRSFLAGVFTGLAAFLAIVLAVVGIEYGRLKDTKSSLITDLDTYFPHLPISTVLFTDIEDYDRALRDWQGDRYRALLDNAREVSSAISDGTLDETKCQQFDWLSILVILYRRSGRRLGRFRIENERLRRLPWDVARVFGAAGGTVLASGLVLACLEPLASVMPGGNPTYLTIPISLALMVSVILIFSFVYSIFSRLASEESEYWFKKSGLPDLTELDILLKGMSDKVKEYRKTVAR